ncbi:MAG: MmcQ/YjbR family DNA-binding protein [Blastocatellia bacterium]
MDIEELRDFCLSFPYAVEDVKWGKDLCFCVGDKIFAVTGLDQTASSQISFKCTPERFAELTERDGIIPAPYVARYHWVAVQKHDALTEDELKDLISNSYFMVFENLPAENRRKLSSR